MVSNLRQKLGTGIVRCLHFLKHNMMYHLNNQLRHYLLMELRYQFVLQKSNKQTCPYQLLILNLEMILRLQRRKTCLYIPNWQPSKTCTGAFTIHMDGEGGINRGGRSKVERSEVEQSEEERSEEERGPAKLAMVGVWETSSQRGPGAVAGKGLGGKAIGKFRQNTVILEHFYGT